jgi:hypothetical protein
MGIAAQHSKGGRAPRAPGRRVDPSLRGPMDLHKYRVGEIVSYRQPHLRRAEQGTFEIEQLLPANAVENQYRLVRRSDGRRRVAGEAELSASEDGPPT